LQTIVFLASKKNKENSKGITTDRIQSKISTVKRKILSRLFSASARPLRLERIPSEIFED